MTRRTRRAGAVVLCLLPIAAHASANPESTRLAASPARSSIVVDGRLSEQAWTAPPFSAFVQRDPIEGAAPTEQTDVRVVFDEQSLYVGVRLYDRYAGIIGRRLSRRDESPDADAVQVYLDPRRDRRSGVFFEVSAAGVQRDALIFNDTELDFSWDGVWDSAISVDERGWTAELRIPFSQLRFTDGGVWGINVARYIRRNHETDWLTLVPRNEAYLASRMADLTGLAAIRPDTPNEVVAYGVTRNAASVTPGLARLPLGGAMGADMKQGLGRDLVLEATVNPDFSQVEGDAAAINLTAFETFREERRPFFTETAPLFQTFGSSGGAFGGAAPTLFYSRRIGQAPASAIALTPLSEPTATPVLGAIKLAGAAAGKWKLTLLDAIGAATTALPARDAAAPPTEVAPLTNFAAGRLLRETERGGVGLLTTAVQRRGSDRSAVASFVPDRAIVGGVDAYVFIDRDREWVVGGQISGSDLSWMRSSSAADPVSTPLTSAMHAMSDAHAVKPPDTPGKGPPPSPPGNGNGNGNGNGHGNGNGNGPPPGHGNGPPATNPGQGPPSQPPANAPPTRGNNSSTPPGEDPPASDVGSSVSGVWPGSEGIVNTGPNRVIDPSMDRLRGWSAHANVHRNSGAVRVNVDAWTISPGFETNDLGYLPRADIQGLRGQVSWTKFDPDSFTRFRSIDVAKGWTRTFAGEKQSDTIDVSSSAVFLNYWSAGAGFSTSRRAFDATATWGGPSVQTPPGRSWWAWGSTDARHLVSLDAGTYFGSNEAGDTASNIWIGATLKPRANLMVAAGPSFGRRVVTAQFVGAVASAEANADASPQYVFATLHADDIALTLRLNAIATPRLSFQVYAQSFAAVGQYSGFKRLDAPATASFTALSEDNVGLAPDFDPALLNLHAVARWEWRRGSSLYLVWTQRRAGSAMAASQRVSQLLQPFDAAPANALMAKLTCWIGR